MSQFLIVQGADGRPDEAALLYRRALTLFQSLAGLRPAAEVTCFSTFAAAFPRVQNRGLRLLQLPSGAWFTCAGTPFYQDEASLPALQQLDGITAAKDADFARLLAPLDGTFVAACGNEASGEFLAITDRIGDIHAYRAHCDGCLLITTSSLVLAALLDPDWDIDSCREFLALGTVFESRTLFRGIEKLAPATVYRFRGGVPVSQTRYWNLPDITYGRTPLRGTVAQLADALNHRLNVIARNFNAPLLDLTGGFDSRIIVASMLKTSRPFETVVVGRKEDPDASTAAAIAAKIGIPLLRLSPAGENAGEWWQAARRSLALCDGEYDLLEYGRILLVHESLCSRFDSSINGSNGEICKGYWWELLFPHTGSTTHFDERRIAAGRFAFSPQGPALMASEHRRDLVEHFASVIRRANAGWEGMPNTSRLDNVYLTLRMQRWHGRIASATDRVWPTISPFLFREPMEVSLAIPPRERMRNRASRRLMQLLNPEMAAMPLAEGYPALPVKLSTLHHFTPLLGEWWHKLSRRVRPASAVKRTNPVLPLWSEPEVREFLEPGSMRTASLYDGPLLQSFLSLSQGEDFSQAAQFGRILTLEMLARAVQSHHAS